MAKTLANALITRYRRFILLRKGVIIHNNTVFSKVEFQGKALIEPYCRLSGDPRISIGNNFYMNAGCHLLGEITIGNDVQIGPKTVIWGRNHGMAAHIPMREQPHEKAPIVIDDDVWIGANVTILKGVRIGKGSVIGAGSVVTRDIPEHAVAVGNPARIIRYRE